MEKLTIEQIIEFGENHFFGDCYLKWEQMKEYIATLPCNQWISVEVKMCVHCPFATAQGEYYCVRSARTIPVPETIPDWCQLRKNAIAVSLPASPED